MLSAHAAALRHLTSTKKAPVRRLVPVQAHPAPDHPEHGLLLRIQLALRCLLNNVPVSILLLVVQLDPRARHRLVPIRLVVGSMMMPKCDRWIQSPERRKREITLENLQTKMATKAALLRFTPVSFSTCGFSQQQQQQQQTTTTHTTHKNTQQQEHTRPHKTTQEHTRTHKNTQEHTRTQEQQQNNQTTKQQNNHTKQQHKTTTTTQNNTTQHNTTQHNTTQHNTTQHNTTQHTRKSAVETALGWYHLAGATSFLAEYLCLVAHILFSGVHVVEVVPPRSRAGVLDEDRSPRLCGKSMLIKVVGCRVPSR